jgi:hypothetical protein
MKHNTAQAFMAKGKLYCQRPDATRQTWLAEFVMGNCHSARVGQSLEIHLATPGPFWFPDRLR